MSVVNALAAAVKTDVDAGVWVIDLEKHFEKLDACK